MEILLLILKITGIVLLVLAGLLLLLTAAVVFVPVRYHIRGRAEGFSDFGVTAVFSWLAHLVHIRIAYENKELDTKLRILGIPIRLKLSGAGAAGEREDMAGDSDGYARETEEAGEETLPNRADMEGLEPGDTEGLESGDITPEMKEKLRQLLESDVTPLSGDHEQKERAAEHGAQPEQNPETLEIPHKKKKKRKNILQRLKIKCRSFLESLKQFWNKMKRLAASAAKGREQSGGIFTKIKEFLAEEANKTAIGRLLQEFRYLLHHFSPRKVSGTLAFGLEDPALTGQILAALSVFGFWAADRISVEPDFYCQEPYVRGNITMKGHIRAMHLIRALARIWKDKNIRSFIRQVKN